ncbi:MAG: hypothetical protein O9346_07910 [Leptospiraceae bacterium]|nr:hypothetical protein [Leptospiraceae bacterium]
MVSAICLVCVELGVSSGESLGRFGVGWFAVVCDDREACSGIALG